MGIFGNIGSSLSGAFTSIKENIQEKVENFQNDEQLANAKENLKDAVANLKDSAASIFTVDDDSDNLAEVAVETREDIVDTIGDTFNVIGAATNKRLTVIGTAISSIFGSDDDDDGDTDIEDGSHAGRIKTPATGNETTTTPSTTNIDIESKLKAYQEAIDDYTSSSTLSTTDTVIEEVSDDD